MAEEHQRQTPVGHRPCSIICGFLDCPTTMNICSNCHGHLCLKKQTCVKSTLKSSISAVPPPLTSAELR
ncbi:unnamed protein product [Brassica napus]|uniref:(rape) hypothetical protein n=1 Tax=Brassica napus TaxID=3708 RepID=A0A816KFY4_BRANA|nr:unnamed protein product [Brassica napus]